LFVLGTLLITSCGEEDDETPQLVGLEVSDFSISIDENPSGGDVIGSIEATSDVGDLSFSIGSQNPVGAIAVNETSGQITVADASLFVFEDNPSITADVSVTDGVSTESIKVTISINNPQVPSFNVWAGASITFTKADGADPNIETNQDRITENVWITRGNNGGQIFNAKVENDSNKSSSPTDTEWALGTTDNIENLTFQLFRDAVQQPKNVVGKDLVLHLITDDIYIDVKFTSWSSGKQGGFSYERSTED